MNVRSVNCDFELTVDLFFTDGEAIDYEMGYREISHGLWTDCHGLWTDCHELWTD